MYLLIIYFVFFFPTHCSVEAQRSQIKSSLHVSVSGSKMAKVAQISPEELEELREAFAKIG